MSLLLFDNIIVGEIADETDPLASPVRVLANGDWYARGDISLEDLADFGIELSSSPSYTSIGGLVLEELGRLAMIGDIVRRDGYSIRVESVRGSRIAAVRIRDHDDRGRTNGPHDVVDEAHGGRRRFARVVPSLEGGDHHGGDQVLHVVELDHQPSLGRRAQPAAVISSPDAPSATMWESSPRVGRRS